MSEERLERQLRIDGWNQATLEKARLGVVGDDDLLASLFILSAAALGINHITALAPRLDERVIEAARRINPLLVLSALEGYYTHPFADEILEGCSAIADLSRFGLANKLLLRRGFTHNVPVVRGSLFEEGGSRGFRVFTYMKGREWQELDRIISPRSLPEAHFDDPVQDIVTAGVALEEVKNVLMGRMVSREMTEYSRPGIPSRGGNTRIAVVGAGALGNFVGLGLAFAGFRDITFFDPDIVEVTNLNRQVLFHDSVGKSKARVLATRLNEWFGTNARAIVSYYRRNSDLDGFDVIFDCVDNFETRIVLSEECRNAGKVLISGGTSAGAGQMVVYNPARPGRTPAELLGLYLIVEKRRVESFLRERKSCVYRPDPSVIMTNQIIAGFMVDALRMIREGGDPPNLFYDASAEGKIR